MADSLFENAGSIPYTEVREGAVYGIIYIPERVRGAVLVVHGFTQDARKSITLCQRIASAGYVTLAIDLPGHGTNPNAFDLGLMAEAIRDSARYLGKRYDKVALVTHSIGAMSALFALAGYDSTLERDLPVLWEQYCATIESLAQLDANDSRVVQAIANLDTIRVAINKRIFAGLQPAVQANLSIRCLVCFAPPPDLRKVFGRGSLMVLRGLPEKTIQKALTKFTKLTEGVREPSRAEGSPRLYDTRLSDPNVMAHHILTASEPMDYLQLIEKLGAEAGYQKEITLPSGTGETQRQYSTFIQYYHDKYLVGMPKLFFYGKYDLLLRPFLGWNKRRIEKMYTAFSNAEPRYRNVNHMFTENSSDQGINRWVKGQGASQWGENAAITVEILQFIDQHMAHR